MRVTLTPQGTGATTALIERDDGVVYSMRGPVAGPVVPHDAVHLLTERELGMRDGIWGSIADGAVYRSMTHVSGRRKPHAAERSAQLIRERAVPLQRAEMLAGLVERVARGEDVAGWSDPGVPVERVRAAADVLREAGEVWRRERRLVMEWPVGRRER